MVMVCADYQINNEYHYNLNDMANSVKISVCLQYEKTSTKRKSTPQIIT